MGTSIDDLCSRGGEGIFSGLVVVEVLIELLRNAMLLSPSAACRLAFSASPYKVGLCVKVGLLDWTPPVVHRWGQRL